MTFPVPVAPFGTVIVMLVGLQPVGVGVAVTPFTVTVLEPCVEPKLVPVMVREDPTAPEFALNMLIVGGASTANDAVLLVEPVPPSVELMAPVVLLIVPAPVPVTLRLMVHDVLAPRVPLLRLTELEPAVAVTVPPQLSTTFGVAATARPPVQESLKATPLRLEAFVLLMVKVSEVVALSAIAEAPNALLMVGG